MIRLTELAGGTAGSPAAGWDQRSVDVFSIVQTARTLRAEFIADHLHRGYSAFGRGFSAFGRWSGVSGLVAALRRRAQRRRTLHALTALDTRALNDIGIDRAEIAATAALSCDAAPAGGGSAWHGLAAWAGREMRRRRTLRELSAMSDELLSDIGIARSEIPAIAAALVAEQSLEAPTGNASAALHEVPVTAQVLAFVEVRRGARPAANRNLDRPAA